MRRGQRQQASLQPAKQERIGRDRLHRGKRVLHAMVQLVDHELQPVLGRAALGDLLLRATHQHNPAGRAADELSPAGDPARLAGVAAADAELEGEGSGRRVRSKGAALLPRGIPLLRMDDVEMPATDAHRGRRARGLQAIEAVHRLGPLGFAGCEVGPEEADAARLAGQPEPRLALAQPLGTLGERSLAHGDRGFGRRKTVPQGLKLGYPCGWDRRGRPRRRRQAAIPGEPAGA